MNAETQTRLKQIEARAARDPVRVFADGSRASLGDDVLWLVQQLREWDAEVERLRNLRAAAREAWSELLARHQDVNFGHPVLTNRGLESVFTIQATRLDLDALAALLADPAAADVKERMYGATPIPFNNCLESAPPQR